MRLASAEDQALLNQVTGFYHAALKQSPEALAYLQKRGLTHPALIDHFRLGFANRTLGYQLPVMQVKAGAALRGALQRIGVYRGSGHEHFTGSLIVIVIFSGYENFVSKIDEADHKDWPEWMGKIDFTGLKLKLLSSIVAISAIQLLKAFMNIKNMSDRDLYWLVIIHLVFVGSGVILALTDKISAETKGH